MLSSVVLSAVVPLLMLANPIAAFQCSFHTFTQCEDGITHWYDPDDGQICDPLDCGGGRAPPKTNVPGCPQYKGTLKAPTGVSYLSCFKSIKAGATATSAPIAVTTSIPVAAATTSTAKPVETKSAILPTLTPISSKSSEPATGSTPVASPSPSTTAAPSQSNSNEGGDKTVQSSSTPGAAKPSNSPAAAPAGVKVMGGGSLFAIAALVLL